MSKKIILVSLVLLGVFLAAGVTFAAGPIIILINPLSGVNNFGDLLTRISGAIVGVLAALSTIMLIIAGGMFLLSAGNPQQIQTARNAVKYAIIGIVVSVTAGTMIAIIKEVIGVTS